MRRVNGKTSPHLPLVDEALGAIHLVGKIRFVSLPNADEDAGASDLGNGLHDPPGDFTDALHVAVDISETEDRGAKGIASRRSVLHEKTLPDKQRQELVHAALGRAHLPGELRHPHLVGRLTEPLQKKEDFFRTGQVPHACSLQENIVY